MRISGQLKNLATLVAMGVIGSSVIAVGGCVTGGAGGAASVRSASISYIEPAVALDLQKNQGVAVVNIGDQAEFDRRRIAASAWIAIDKLAAFASSAPDKVVVYDSGFGAIYSDTAQPVLNALGNKIQVVKGGLAAWERNGLPVTGVDSGSDPKCVPVRVEELRRALDQQDDFIVIDLRRREDYEATHIRDAVWALSPEIADLYKKRGKNRWVIAIDQSGLLDAGFAAEMARHGVRYCGYVVGGYDAWVGRPGRTAAGK